MENRYNLRIANINNYNIDNLEIALNDYIKRNASVKSNQLSKELNPRMNPSTIIGEALLFDKENSSILIRSKYETNKINMYKYKIKIECLGKNINGDIHIINITGLTLIK